MHVGAVNDMRHFATVALVLVAACSSDREREIIRPGNHATPDAGPDAAGATGAGPGDPRPGALEFQQIAAGGTFTCGIASERLYCWGSDLGARLGDGPGSTLEPHMSSDRAFGFVAAGYANGCALTAAGEALCWGRGAYGANGDGTTDDRDVPTPVDTTARFAAVSIGPFHTCGVTEDGAAHCWGRNDRGALGDGTYTQRTRPVAVAGGATFRSVHAGNLRSCGVTLDDELWCWGAILGGSNPRDWPEPVRVRGDVRSYAPSTQYDCAVQTDGSVSCWDLAVDDLTDIEPWPLGLDAEHVAAGSGPFRCFSNAEGQVHCVGDGRSGAVGPHLAIHEDPVEITLGRPVHGLSASIGHACALGPTGHAFCWGDNGAFELGEDPGADTPTRHPSAPEYTRLAVGDGFACGIGGITVSCWGRNSTQALGRTVAEAMLSDAPLNVDIGEAVDVAAGGGDACALGPNGVVTCWGDGAAPAPVPGDARFATISLGSRFGCGLTVDDEILCWGLNDHGQVGAPAAGAEVDVPVLVLGDASVVVAGHQHACAIDAQGGTRCWGRLVDEQGLLDDQPSPVQIEGSHGFKSLAAGLSFTCGIDAEGAAHCWGFIGETPSAVPIAVAGIDEELVEIDAGSRHVCARAASGAVWCWGENTFNGSTYGGQLGDGTTMSRTAPVRVEGSYDAVSAGNSFTCALRGEDTVCWGIGNVLQLGKPARPVAVAPPVASE